MILMVDSFSAASTRKLKGIISKRMASLHVPGLSIALLKDDEVVYKGGFGARNVESNLPATPDTLYGIGSCTKSFTTIAIMQLVAQERIDLHDPVNKYFPYEPGYEDEPITIHHLLSMSSGMPADGMAGILIQRMTGVEGSWIPLSDIDDLLLFINNSKGELAARPGKRYFYYNSGFAVLGEIVERVGGVPYEDYIAENILKPLSMARSTIKRETFDADSDRMTAYRKEKDGSTTATVHPFHRMIYAAGGILSPVTELTSYLKMNLNGGVHDGKRIVDEDLLMEMHTGHIERGEGAFGKGYYCYGWSCVDDFLGHKMVNHGGSTGVSSANLSFIPDLDIGVATASNTGGFGPLIPQAALTLLMDRDPEEAIPYYAEELDLDRLTGYYEAYEGGSKQTVARKGVMLYLESSSRFAETSIPLIPESREAGNRRFHYLVAGGRIPVEFEEAPNGGMDLYIERWRLHRKGK